MADKGHWPVGGGVLDQAAVFVEAFRFVQGEEATHKLKLIEDGKKDL